MGLRLMDLLIQTDGGILENLVTLIKIMAIFAAAGILGSWFLSEAKKSKLKGEPAYKPYLSLPGIIIALLILLLPILAWLLNR